MGVLEPLEFKAYDQMMRMRPQEKPDERILVIVIDKNDLAYQDNELGAKRAEYSYIDENEAEQVKKRSLAGEALYKLLTHLESYQPAVIGVDVLREISSTDDYPPLAEKIKNTDNLFFICKGEDEDNQIDPSGVPPPPEFKNSPTNIGFYNSKEIRYNRVGFSDVVLDRDNEMVRRFLWSANFRNNTHCLPDKFQPAFSMSISQYYLYEQHGISLKEDFLKQGIWETTPNSIRLTTWVKGGAYRNFDTYDKKEGYQMMLNYRAVGSDQRDLL